LDEVREADILLHVVDISHPAYEEQMGVVNKTLQDIKAFDKPILVIFNKMDLYEKNVFDEWLDESVKKEILEDLRERWQMETDGNAIFISAIEKRNIELLRKSILDKVREMYKVRYPYKTGFYPLSP
jgi:GTP-binding protein HflX